MGVAAIKAWYMMTYKGIWDESVLTDPIVMDRWALHLRTKSDRAQRAKDRDFLRKMMDLSLSTPPLPKPT